MTIPNGGIPEPNSMAKILILEDDTVSARLLVQMISTQGHSSRATDRVADAWQLLIEDPVDLLILDTDLGNEWGWEMLELVRQSTLFRRLPSVVYSATWRREIVARYLNLGVQGLLVKPYAPTRLAQEITRAIETQWRQSFFAPLVSAAARATASVSQRALSQLAADAPQLIVNARALSLDPLDRNLRSEVIGLRERVRLANYMVLQQILDDLLDAFMATRPERIPLLAQEVVAALRVLEQALPAEPPCAPDEAGAAPAMLTPLLGRTDTATGGFLGATRGENQRS